MSTKLVIEYDFDFELYGLITPHKSFKLAYLINEKIEISLCRNDDLALDFGNRGQLTIANYSFESEYSHLTLYKNKADEFLKTNKPFLIPELKEYDYFFKFEGEGDLFESGELEDRLRSIDQVQYIKRIEVTNLQSKDNLIG